SSNRRKAVQKLAKKHLKVSRQRKDFAVKTAKALVQSNDLVVYVSEAGRSPDLQVKNMVKNRHLAKSISDASWSLFIDWIDYYAKVFDTWAIAVAPHYTSTDCSVCGTRVKKSLSTRTHRCHSCGTVMHRDHNAAKLILLKGINSVPSGRRDLKLVDRTTSV
ncbi:MAG: transposase, partial [Symploca sp. SIO2E6]|nr:transposase [Symploca sp. SIO2E6]